jgi:hypothetical protein
VDPVAFALGAASLFAFLTGVAIVAVRCVRLVRADRREQRERDEQLAPARWAPDMAVDADWEWPGP